MLKLAFEEGVQLAYVTFKIAAARAPRAAPAVPHEIPLSPMPAQAPAGIGGHLSNFAQGQWGHLQNAGGGIKNMFTMDPTQRAAGASQAMAGLRGALPTLGGAAALGLGAAALSGPSEEEKRQHAMQQMMMMRGGM